MDATQAITIGRIVHYRLNASDAEIINKRRTADSTEVGNNVGAGEASPAIVVRVNSSSGRSVNLQVFLDGNDSYWATSRTIGDEEGQWFWPPRT